MTVWPDFSCPSWTRPCVPPMRWRKVHTTELPFHPGPRLTVTHSFLFGLSPFESPDKLLTHRPLFGSIGQASEPGVLRRDSGENASQIALLPLRDWFASGCVCPEEDEEARQIRDYGEGWPGRHGCCV